MGVHLGKVTVLAVRCSFPATWLMPNRWGTAGPGGWLPAAVPPVGHHFSHVAVHTLSRHPIDPLPWGVIGYQRQIDQTRLKIDAQPDLQSLISATMTIRLSLTASSPHSNAGHAGGNPID